MAIVTISEAARLTGKSRQTLHRHIVTGKLSKCNTEANGIGIDTSELLRVYGSIKDYNVTPVKNKQTLHKFTDNVTHVTIDKNQQTDTIQQLEKELAILKVKVDEQEKRINAKQETIDTLKSALKLLEYKQTKDSVGNSDPLPDKEPKAPLNEVKGTKNEKGLLGRFKKLFR